MTTSCAPEVRQILVLTRLERRGNLAPCTRTGSILWNRVPGFTTWLGTYGPVLTNHELIAAIGARHGVRITLPSAMSLRRSYDVRMRLAARRRAYVERDGIKIAPTKSTTPAVPRLRIVHG